MDYTIKHPQGARLSRAVSWSELVSISYTKRDALPVIKIVEQRFYEWTFVIFLR